LYHKNDTRSVPLLLKCHFEDIKICDSLIARHNFCEQIFAKQYKQNFWTIFRNISKVSRTLQQWKINKTRSLKVQKCWSTGFLFFKSRSKFLNKNFFRFFLWHQKSISFKLSIIDWKNDLYDNEIAFKITEIITEIMLIL
jgi:hypothetical protein